MDFQLCTEQKTKPLFSGEAYFLGHLPARNAHSRIKVGTKSCGGHFLPRIYRPLHWKISFSLFSAKPNVMEKATMDKLILMCTPDQLMCQT